MKTESKLAALQARLEAEQRKVLTQAAEAGILPPLNALAFIASAEGAMAALESVIEEGRPAPPPANARPVKTPNPAKAAIRHTGTVKWFDTAKRFGFITPDNGDADVFVHLRMVEQAGLSYLYQGQRLAYEVVPDRRTGKPTADKLKVATK